MLEDSLVSACRDGNTAALISCLQQPTADVNVVTAGGGLLHHAVSAGHTHMVSLLLSHPCIQPNLQDPAGLTAVHLACSQGRDKLVRMMIKSETVNVDINKPCYQWFNPLLTAAMAGHRFCVSALLSSKFLNLNVTWQGMSAETLASRNGHKKIAKIIQVRVCIAYAK